MTQPYTEDELKAANDYANKFRDRIHIDEWHTVPNHPTLDIHFLTHEVTEQVEAWLYRRDGINEGQATDANDCRDELRLF